MYRPRSLLTNGRILQNKENYDTFGGTKPHFKKPWATFTQDVLALTERLTIKHLTQDNAQKKASKRHILHGKKVIAKGDVARLSLHLDTFYGAIKQNGEQKFVVRKSIQRFTNIKDCENIVDEGVKAIVKAHFKGRNFKEALAEPIYMNKEKGILINKVRCLTDLKNLINLKEHRDKSGKDYKTNYHVRNEENYLVAIYKGKKKGKAEIIIINNLEAIKNFTNNRTSTAYSPLLSPYSPKYKLPLKMVLKKGLQVLLYEKTSQEINFDNQQQLVKRLYKIKSLGDRVELVHCQEARKKEMTERGKADTSNLDSIYRPTYRIAFSNFNALIEGVDFEINILGEIIPKKKEI